MQPIYNLLISTAILISTMHVGTAASLNGKSIDATYKLKPYRTVLSLNVQMYISKNGKEIFDYATSNTGNRYSFNVKQRGFIWRKRGNKITFTGIDRGTTQTVTYIVTGNKCVISHTLREPNSSFVKNYKIRLVKCRVYEGNKFKN